MSRAALAVALAVLALGVAAAPADAQFIFGDDGARVVRVHELPVAVRGDVALDLRGDEPAGCAERRLCDVSGTVAWRTPRRGTIFLVEYVGRDGRRGASGLLAFDGDGTTTTRVERAGAASQCVDARRTAGAFELTSPSPRVVAVGLTSGLSVYDDIVATRCGGPLAADVAAAMPAREIPLRDLRRGRLTIDLAGERAWSGGGLAGVVRSTLSLRVGRPFDEGDEGRRPRLRARRMRVVSVRYRLERASGTIAVRYAGVGDALACGPLDACDLAGTTTVPVDATRGVVDLWAEGPASIPRRRFLAALGIVRGGRARQIDLFGTGNLRRGGPAVTTQTRADAPACADSAPLGPAALTLVGRGRTRVAVSLAATGAQGALRTRCPGPLATDFTSDDALAAGSMPLRALGRRRVLVRLTRARTFEAPGYAGRVEPDAAVVLRRERVRERTFTTRIPEDF